MVGYVRIQSLCRWRTRVCILGQLRLNLSADIIDDRVLIFRITHIDNVSTIARYGLCSKNYFLYPHYEDIGGYQLIKKRTSVKVPNYPYETATLADFVSFYFTPCSPMLHNILRGKNVQRKLPPNEIVFMVSSIVSLAKQNVRFCFSDRHVLSSHPDPVFSDDLMDLDDHLDWDAITAWTDGRGRMNSYEYDKLVSQAEALVYEKVPTKAISKFVVYDSDSEKRVRYVIDTNARCKEFLNIPVEVDERFYK